VHQTRVILDICKTAAANMLIFDVPELFTFRHFLEDFTVKGCNNAVLNCVFTHKIVSKRTQSCFPAGHSVSSLELALV
jgi:hypothetical protein